MIYFDLFEKRVGYVVNANRRVKSHYFIADVKRFMEVATPSAHILLCPNNSRLHVSTFRRSLQTLWVVMVGIIRELVYTFEECIA